MEKIRNREEAGEKLAGQLAAYKERKDVLVLALPRGGVPVAEPIARELKAPLEVFIVRKLGVPGHRELAMGAIASGGVRVMNMDVVRSMGISEEQIEKVAAEETSELARRENQYRGDRNFPEISGKTVILVDDGVATGATMRVAIKALREGGAQKLVVAVPVAPPDTCAVLSREADELICPFRPSPFHAIGLWYEDFSQVSDEEVGRILKES
ncbi:phosphoribosyltransferase [Desulfuromonas sp. TF]|uniref:phosphoribosyltransferase n=1 Tax=Desulfuromonas sp. TF TaxID=1232410 RepID=UPI0003FDB16B|nr:phosphoribosyltransferase [Desulfuromonas sp. TF]